MHLILVIEENKCWDNVTVKHLSGVANSYVLTVFYLYYIVEIASLANLFRAVAKDKRIKTRLWILPF